MGNNDSEKSRKDQMLESFVNTGTDTVTEWGTYFIKSNVPKTLDWTVKKIKEMGESIAKREHESIKNSFHEVMLMGMEIGENNKEQALQKAMQQVGIEDAQIQAIVELSKQYMIQIEALKSECNYTVLDR